jgi:hypothetical protein
VAAVGKCVYHFGGGRGLVITWNGIAVVADWSTEYDFCLLVEAVDSDSKGDVATVWFCLGNGKRDLKRAAWHGWIFPK